MLKSAEPTAQVEIGNFDDCSEGYETVRVEIGSRQFRQLQRASCSAGRIWLAPISTVPLE